MSTPYYKQGNRFSKQIIKSCYKSAKGVCNRNNPQITRALDELKLNYEKSSTLFNEMMEGAKMSSEYPEYDDRFLSIYLLAVLSDSDMDELIINWAEPKV